MKTLESMGMKRHGGLRVVGIAWAMLVGLAMAEPKKVVPEPSCVDLGVGMLEWAFPDDRAGRRIKVIPWKDFKEVQVTNVRLRLPLDKGAVNAGRKPPAMWMHVTRLPAPHPRVWKDDVTEDRKGMVEHGDPTIIPAKVKREGFQQLIDVAVGNERVLKSLEWYGPLGEIEANHPKQPVLLEWMSGYEVGYEIVRPRFIQSADGFFRGFEAFRLIGQDYGFSPEFHAQLLSVDRTIMLEFTLSLDREPELKDRIERTGELSHEHAEKNYRLLREDFPGEDYREVAETVRRAREVVKTLRWRDAEGKLVPVS